VAAIALGVAVFFAARRAPTRASQEGSAMTLPADVRAAAEAGDTAAIAALIERLDGLAAPATQTAELLDLLASARPEVRAAACALIGRHPHRPRELTVLLLLRMNDADWRVRAAAFDAMTRAAGDLPGAPRFPAPLRDTPPAQREDYLFAWINGWQGSVDVQSPLAELCEIYAPASGHWLTGPRLAQSCLACHSPPDAYGEADFASCADCHRGAHGEFFRSAHARSTTHLHLLRVNDQTKQVEPYDVGPREGLVCTTCHVPAKDAAGTKPLPRGTENLAIPHRFAAAIACATCHAETQREWETWRTNPRPIPSRWLPGDFTWDESPDARTCVSCHMQPRATLGGTSPAGLVHAFGARRDAAFMRNGISAHIEPPTGARGPQLVLTNLAGHRYPSGTIRRALRIELRYNTDPPETKRLLTKLTDSPLPSSQPTQPALAPGEQRRIELPTIPGASRATCEITFERNQYEPGSYELPLHTVSERTANPLRQ
jgi:hypothetical protein